MLGSAPGRQPLQIEDLQAGARTAADVRQEPERKRSAPLGFYATEAGSSTGAATAAPATSVNHVYITGWV